MILGWLFGPQAPQLCCFGPHQKGALENSRQTNQSRSDPDASKWLLFRWPCAVMAPSWCHRMPLLLFSLFRPDSYNPDRRPGGRYRRAAAIIALFSHLNSERLTNTAVKRGLAKSAGAPQEQRSFPAQRPHPDMHSFIFPLAFSPSFSACVSSSD